MAKRVLIVELNPYHGEILPGFVKLFLECGYRPDVLIREEILKENPFIIMTKNEQPNIISGSASYIADRLKDGLSKQYDIVFFATNVFWEKDVNISSVFRYLNHVPSGKKGSIFIEHNLSNLKIDDSEYLLNSGRIATLLPYMLGSQQTKMINPHYFGRINFEKKLSSRRRIVIVGALSKEPYVRNIINSAVREHLDKDFEIVIINGDEKNVPKDIRHIVTVTSRLNFEEYYNQLGDADFILTVFSSNDLATDKYLNGTTSGAVQVSLGFHKPLIIDVDHAKQYGLTKNESVHFAFNNLSDGIEQALIMSDDQYESMRKSLIQKSTDMNDISISNLQEMIDIMDAKGYQFLEGVNAKTMVTVKENNEIEEMHHENDRLRYKIKKQAELITQLQHESEDLKVHINKLWTHLHSKHFVIADKLLEKYNKTAPYGSSRRKVITSPVKFIKRATSKYNLQKTKLKIRKDKKIVASSDLFNKDYYLQNNNDIDVKTVDPIEHYLTYGYSEGRQPSIDFDAEFYQAKYADVRNSGTNPLVHYLKFGKNEGRERSLHQLGDTNILDLRPVIALQIDSFDRGGLEEVVLSIVTNKTFKERYQVYIFVTGDGNGYLADKARQSGVNVLALNYDDQYLKYLIKKLNIKFVNLHYSIFGIDSYRENGVSLVYTIHNNYIWADEEFQHARTLAYQKIDSFIAVSDQVADFFSARFEVERNKITTVLNGVDNKKLEGNFELQTRASFGLTKNDFVFINVASFSPYKFQIDAIAAMKNIVKNHPNTKLIMVGNVISPKYFSMLKEKIKEYELEKHIQLIDYLPKEKLLGLLKISDSFVLPSLTEGFSIAMIEAMYSELPLVLTDVGGARHAIEESDIGIIVSNVYGRPDDLTQIKIDTLYSGDENLVNLRELTNAMESMVTKKVEWKKKAKLGREKVKKLYTIDRMVQGYISKIEKTLYVDQDSVLMELNSVLNEVRRAFVAPFPSAERVREGWMSRIYAIDQIIGDIEKIYINVAESDAPPVIKKYSEGQYELSIGTLSLYYPLAMQRIIDTVDSVYVHTLHLAEYALPWLDSNKVVVDFHGVTPEEEVMLGRPYLKDKYEYIEVQVLEKAHMCVMVTQAMIKHYEAKYSNIEIKDKVIILPIVENLKPAPRNSPSTNNTSMIKSIVYSGGIQVWQNLTSMLRLSKLTESFATATFLSHEWQEVQRQGELYGLKPDTRYEFCEKSKLKERYMEFDFGFALRDDTAVNRVACPTKLYEYLSCGIIPIVRLIELGDFNDLGYKFVTENDFREGKIPSDIEIGKMRNQNYKVVDKMNNTYIQGKKKLAEKMKTSRGK